MLFSRGVKNQKSENTFRTYKKNDYSAPEPTGWISTKLCTKHPCVKEIKAFTNKGPFKKKKLYFSLNHVMI